MNTHVIKEEKDELQNHTAGQRNHSAHSLNLVKPGINSLDWYELTETSNYILNAIIAYASKAQMKEERSSNPDKEKIIYLEKLYEEVYAVNRDTANFNSLNKMQEIIDKYSPILKALHN
jgi:hypothetical protein